MIETHKILRFLRPVVRMNLLEKLKKKRKIQSKELSGQEEAWIWKEWRQMNGRERIHCTRFSKHH